MFECPHHGGQHLAILENFVAAILDGAPLIAPAREGVGAVELANAILWSAGRQAPVELPLDAAGYAAHLRGLVARSQFKKPATRHAPAEVAPYLAKEN